MVVEPRLIDSVDSATTGYSKFGDDPSGFAYGQLGPGFPARSLPAPLATKKAEEVFSKLSQMDRKALLDEIEESDLFAPYLSQLLNQPDPVKALKESAIKAAINELDPSMYPEETRGRWLILRREIRNFPKKFVDEMVEDIKRLTFDQKIKLFRSLGKPGRRAGILPVEAGMGFLGGLLGSLAPALVDGAFDIGGDYLQGKIAADLKEEIAQLEVGMKTALGEKKLQMEKELAEKRMALETALREKQMQIEAGKEIAVTKETAFDWWMIPVGLGVLGAAIYFITRK
jgi:hypothetical protein